MAQWNHTDRTLLAKIVYYGPALGGKTTNLEQIHRITDPDNETKLISLKTSRDRTLFFDLLPFDLGQLFGYSIKFQVYTVPGQVRYNATRRLVLKGVDGIVFVADSSPNRTRENRGAWKNLGTNLKALRMDLDEIAVVLQLNKQDLEDALPPDKVRKNLRLDMEGIAASALEGRGVMETFLAATKATLEHLVRHGPGTRRGQVEAGELSEQVERALERFLVASGSGEEERVANEDRPAESEMPAVEDGPAEGGPPAPGSSGRTAGAGEANAEPAVTGSAPRPGEEAVADTEDIPEPRTTTELLEKSLEQNLSMASEYTEMRDLRNRLAARVRELEDLHRLVGDMNRTRDETRILRLLARAANDVPGAEGVAILVENASKGTLERRVADNLSFDPLELFEGPARPLVDRMLASGAPLHLRNLSEDLRGFDLRSGLAALDSLIAIPLLCSEHPRILLFVFGPQHAPGSLGKQELQYITVLATQAVTALDNAVLYKRMARFNEHLEDEVRSRSAELRQAYEKLAEIDQMKDRFLSNISHEMRTPLTAIITTSELLEEMTPPDDERAEFNAIIREEARRLATMVEDVIQLWVLRQGGSSPVFAPVEIEQAVESAVRQAEPKAREQGVDLQVEPPPRPMRLSGDPYLLALAVRHLIDNAIKFSPRGGTIRVSAQPVEGSSEDLGMPMVGVSVKDMGPGIPPRERRRLLERFEQGGDILTSKPAGMGLGLSLVREILRHHGGRLEIEEGTEGGTVCRLLIPERNAESDEAVDVVHAEVVC